MTLQYGPFLVIVGDRLAVLYRRNGDKFRGRKYNHDTGRWARTSTIRLSDIAHWHHSYPPRMVELHEAWAPIAAAALASLPETEEMDEDTAKLANTRPMHREKVAGK